MFPSGDNPTPPPLGALHAGDPAAWRQAFTQLWGPVVRAARRQLNDAGEAEEAAAQALHETRQAVATTRSWSEVGALAVVIARRRAISRSRSLAALKRQPGTQVPLDSLEAADAEEPPQYAAARVLDVQAILAGLPPAQRGLLQEYFLAGLTSEEVARKRGVPAATVRSQVMRLLAQLRERELARRNSPTQESDSSTGTIL
jgi:RNA polymerase sigma factor (sigma-70 family)